MSKDLWLWFGGALVVVAGVVLWLVLSAPESNTLAETYRFGVL